LKHFSYVAFPPVLIKWHFNRFAKTTEVKLIHINTTVAQYSWLPN